MNLAGQLFKKTLWRKIEIIKVGVIDKIMTPIAAMLAFNCFKLLLFGSIILICHILVLPHPRYRKLLAAIRPLYTNSQVQ